jgi:hypothetical protein
MIKPTARVRVVYGEHVLDDPDALAVARAVAKHNCKNTFALHSEAVAHFERRIHELGRTPDEAVIVLLNADDSHGGALAEVLMSGFDWGSIRARGEVPFARGLAERAGIQGALELFDLEASAKLRGMRGVAVVVVDHGVAEVFGLEE